VDDHRDRELVGPVRRLDREDRGVEPAPLAADLADRVRRSDPDLEVAQPEAGARQPGRLGDQRGQNW
jgi:hypothetical protein